MWFLRYARRQTNTQTRFVVDRGGVERVVGECDKSFRRARGVRSQRANGGWILHTVCTERAGRSHRQRQTPRLPRSRYDNNNNNNNNYYYYYSRLTAFFRNILDKPVPETYTQVRQSQVSQLTLRQRSTKMPSSALTLLVGRQEEHPADATASQNPIISCLI